MTIDVTQTQGLTRDLTREPITAPRATIDSASADAAASSASGDGKSFSLLGDGDLSFWDLLDVINPLQNIPIINSVYREITGDTIKPAAKLIGGALFGGPIGLGFAALDVGIQGMTGKDMGEHAVAMLDGSKPDAVASSYRQANDAWEKNGGSWDGIAWLKPDADRSVAAAATETPVASAAPAAATVAAATAAAAASTAGSDDGDAEPAAPPALPALTVIPETLADDGKTAAQTAAESTETAAETQGLPAWGPLPQPVAAEAPRLQGGTAPAASGKSRPVPQYRNAYADSPKALAALRASTTGKATGYGGSSAGSPAAASAALPSGLTPDAMRAAGLTPDMVQDVLKAHAADAATDTAATAQAAEAAPAAADNAWFANAMSQGLDKYRNAQVLSGNSASTASEWQ